MEEIKVANKKINVEEANNQWLQKIEENTLQVKSLNENMQRNIELQEELLKLRGLNTSTNIKASLIVPTATTEEEALAFVNEFYPLHRFISSKTVYSNASYTEYHFNVDKQNFRRIYDWIFERGLDYILVDMDLVQGQTGIVL